MSPCGFPIFFYAVTYGLSEKENCKYAAVCMFLHAFLHASKLKKNNVRSMQWFKTCMILAGPLTKLGQGFKSSSADVTNRRKKQKVIVYPFEETRASVWHRQANNEFSWERNQSEPRSLLTLTHFVPARVSIVYLLLFAFTRKS